MKYLLVTLLVFASSLQAGKKEEHQKCTAHMSVETAEKGFSDKGVEEQAVTKSVKTKCPLNKAGNDRRQKNQWSMGLGRSYGLCHVLFGKI